MTQHGKTPFLDLVTPHLELEEELVAVFRAALKTAGFIGGPMLEGFEREFAQFCDSPHCVGVASGTDALRFALMAAGGILLDAVELVLRGILLVLGRHADVLSRARRRPRDHGC